MQESGHEAEGRPPAAAPSSQDPLEVIMAAGELPAAAPKSKARDLAADAMAAALDATAEPRTEPAQRGPTAQDREVAAAPAVPPGRAQAREWWWRGLLILNVAVLAAVVALPSRNAPPAKDGSAPREGAAPGVQGDAREPESGRRLGFAISEQAFYLRALELAGEAKFDDAIAVLEGHLKANPDLSEVEQRLTYHALAMFAVRAGRTDDANRYEAAMDRLRVGAQLPQDLLDLAKQAEAEGRGADMRRYYARFLLQHKQVPPSLRARIAEAYLKLGDGYRIEAERGAEREAANKRAADGPPPKPAPGGPERGGHK